MTIRQIISNIIAVEGSTYTNDPKDSGGPTKYGITLATLSAHRGKKCTAADVEALTEDEARVIYHEKFVVKPGFSNLLFLSARIGEELVDTGVNAGPARAATMLQRCLNALNRQGKDYADIPVDGECGPATVAALKALLAKRGKDGETIMLRALNCLQGEFYIDLAERRPKDESFLAGWLLNRVVIA
jgi:lysozyme family protein